MKEDIQQTKNENLVTFPASKNFSKDVRSDSISTPCNPIDDLINEIEQMELIFNNQNDDLENKIIDDFNFEFDKEVFNNRVFPKKKALTKMISTLKNDEFYIGPQSSLDQLLTVMRTRITELQECHKRVRFYVNEIKLNQK